VRTGASESDAPKQASSQSAKDAVVHLGVVGAARVGDGQIVETLGALSFLELANWIFGLDGRAANYDGGESSRDATSMSTLEFATFGGRRFDKSTPLIDVKAGPSIVLQQTNDVETGPEGTTRTRTSRVVPRFSFGGRLHMFKDSAVSGFIGLEGILALPGVETSDGPEEGPPPLPMWMVGLSVGATVGLR
jgi:hypothetical protein